ncbi:MAG TPA: SAM-dependent chlorinase/fluorinase [Candidatus Acidoferrum sp.]|nr:SAM-dependent chlorinase/fluorinase [Candidatus Acidoferrum sp.]
MPGPLLTLTTDYGTSDQLVGTLKGVILKIQPDAQIVDINHSVVPYDVLDGALSIGAAYRYFPTKTVHIVIVDPGVGTERRPILVSANNQYFIAPDNGVLSLVYEREDPLVVRHITSEHYFTRPVSATFHGRDIFAPVAAWLAKNWQTEAFGEVITDFTRFALPRPKAQDGAMRGAVLRSDHFGNLITNFTLEDLPEPMRKPGPVKISIAGKPVKQFVETFAQGPAGEAVALVGSTGFIEIAVNKGNAARVLGAARGAEVVLKLA